MYPYQNPSLLPLERAKDLVSRMSLPEKAAQTCMLRGVEYRLVACDYVGCRPVKLIG